VSNLLATLLHSRRRPRAPMSAAPMAATDTVTVAALRAPHLVTSLRGPVAVDAPAPSTDFDAIEGARHQLEAQWSARVSIDDIRAELDRAGIPEHVIRLLLAERRAVDRIVAAGLDATVVRSDVDHLLRHHYR
jgi:hypothetical protein